MLHKLFKGSFFALVAVVVALSASLAQAAQIYHYEGNIVEVRDRNVTIINNKDQSVVHATVPANVHLTPSFKPGDIVQVQLTKTNYGLWNIVKMRKVGDASKMN